MKVSIANIFIKNGDIEYNYNLFQKYYNEAIEKSIEILIFPRLFLTGPINNFLDKDFVKKSIDFLEKIVNLTKDKDTSVIIGGIYFLDEYFKDEIKYDSTTNDSAFFIKNGYLEEIISRKEYSKFNEFNDYRYFDKGLYLKNFEYKYNKFSVFISDDIYSDNNIFLLKSQNTDILICLDSTTNTNDFIKNRLIKISKFFRKPIVYLNNTTFVNNNFINGDVFIIDEEQKIILSDNYKNDNLYDFYIDYDDGSKVFINKIVNDVVDNKQFLINALSKIEGKKILLKEKLNINFEDYCSLYNNFNEEDKNNFEKMVLKYLFKDSICI